MVTNGSPVILMEKCIVMWEQTPMGIWMTATGQDMWFRNIVPFSSSKAKGRYLLISFVRIGVVRERKKKKIHFILLLHLLYCSQTRLPQSVSKLFLLWSPSTECNLVPWNTPSNIPPFSSLCLTWKGWEDQDPSNQYITMSFCTLKTLLLFSGKWALSLIPKHWNRISICFLL